MMEKQRHAKDIAHPMYGIIDNASSAAAEDVYNVIEYMKVIIFIMFTHWSFIISIHKNSKACDMCRNTSY